MRLFSTPFLVIIFISWLGAQEQQGRAGRYLLDGSSSLGSQSLNIGGGVFATDRLLARLFYRRSSQILSPSVRYYLAGGDRWRPYFDITVNLDARERADILRSVDLTIGLEREIVESVLLNTYVFGSRNWPFDNVGYGVQGELNALLGGTAGRLAAEEKLNAGGLNIGNHLGRIGFTTGDMFNFSSFSLNPSIGLLLSEHDQLNVQPLLTFDFAEREDNTPTQQGPVNTSFVTLRIDVGYRRYLFTGALFNPYAEGFAGYRVRFGTVNRNGDRTRSTSLRVDFGLKAGATTFISPAVSIDTDLSVNRWVIDDRSGLFVSLNGGLRFWLK